MDQKPDAQENPSNRFDILKNPDCKDLEEHESKNCPKQLVKRSTDSSDADKCSGRDEQKKRQCYRCENCNLSFADNQRLEDHKKNCLSMPVMSKSDTSCESSIDSLRSVMVSEKNTFDTLKNAVEIASETILRYSATLKLKYNAHQAYENAVEKESTTTTVVSEEEELNMISIIKQTQDKLQVVSKELQELEKLVNQALCQLKYYHQMATTISIKTHFAFVEIIEACKEKVMSTSLSQEANQGLTQIVYILKLQHNTLTQLQNSVAGLKQAILGMKEIWEHVSFKDRNGIYAVHNLIKELANNVRNQMNIIENLDNQRPSTSEAHKSEDLKSEETKKASCARRLFT